MSKPELTPLANDPESLTDFAVTIGLDATCFQFAELFGFDEDVFAFIPKPVLALIFLFPIGEDGGALENRHRSDESISGACPWFSKQTVGNACGTIAVMHSIMNNLGTLKIRDGTWLAKFAQESRNKDPDERAKMIEDDDSLLELHEESAVEDQTPIGELSFASHFCAFVTYEGKLWELDGRKPQPICHGPCQDLMRDAVKVITTDFAPHIEDLMHLSMCAFCGPSE